MQRIVFLISFFLLLITNVFAQTSNSFSNDPTVFLKEATQLLTDTKRDDCQQTARELQDTWPKFSRSQQSDIIELANIMKEKKMLVTPYFQKFFNAVVSFRQSSQSDDFFDSWKEVTIAVINGQRQGSFKKYEQYLDFSYALFSRHALYISEGRTWKLDTDAFELVMENDNPVLKVDDCTIIGITSKDSLRIEGTGGSYFPMESKWQGNKGRADWTRVGFGADEVYATFKNYTIDCRQSDYSADSARLFYEAYDKKNITGKFSDRLLSFTDPETTTYPRFESYRKDLLFDNIAPHVKLYGGITLQGAKLNANGTADQKAMIKIFRYDKLLGVVAKSVNFEINKEKEINASQAEVKLLLGKDSILHGGVTLRYNSEKRELYLFRGKNGIEKSAFYDYYHSLEISPDVIFWDMNEPTLYLRNISQSGESEVVLESFDYYSLGKMEKFQNIADYNIIEKLRTIVETTGQKEFTTEDLAKKLGPKYAAQTIKGILYKLVEDGFVDYDDQKELVTIKYKTFHYVDAKKNKTDYDNIRIDSKTDSVNAEIDMRSMDMDLRGVRDIALSDSNFVVVFPREKNVTVKQNRDMDFSGTMFAGRLDMSGDGFGFDYDDFKIELSTVDSVLINIPTGKTDEHGQPTLGPIKSIIEAVTGNLQIDAKNNRSGRARNKQYPILTTTAPSFVYYDHPRTLGGVYDRDKFYFQLNPFVFDSLNKFKTLSVGFDGKLVSGGIFPDMNDRIGIQQDLSLGFKTKKTDIALYGGKGGYTNQISLDNTGLRGKGTIKFLASISTSRDIIFYPDSLNAKSDSFTISSTVLNGIEYPNVDGRKDFIHWIPYNDSMVVKMDTVPFRIFDGKTTLRGALVLQSSGLSGSGNVDWNDATLSARDIDFGKNKMKADSADFTIKSLDPKKFALKTSDVSATIDFDKRMGVFKSNTDDISTLFPYNQYRTSINEFKWEMDKKKMTFAAPAGTVAEFTSIQPDQDSLTFSGGTATYDMQNYILKINKVPYIAVADAHIFPDSGKVVIEAEARMRTLNRAKIVMDSVDEYHKFDSVSANIYGRNSLKASGIYSYVNKTGKGQKVKMDDIGVFTDSTKVNYHVYAKGVVDTAQRFTLIPKVFYKGKVNIKSNDERVQFDGFAKLDISNPKVKAEWFSIDDYMNKDSAYVKYTDPENESHKPMTAGMVFDADSSDLYTSFFNAKKSSRDKNLFVANGIVFYDEKAKEFVAGDPDKILNEATRGNVLRYNDATGKVKAEGKMNLGFNFGMVDVMSAGEITTDVNKNNPVFNVALGIHFDIDKELLALMTKSILQGNYDEPDADYGTESFQKALPEFIDPKKEKAFNDAFNASGNIVRSDALPFTIFLSNVELKWDKTSKAFYNVKPFSIAFIDDKSMARVVSGYIELGFKRSGDYMNLYIPAGDEDFWYYFYYAAGNMQIVAGEQSFNEELVKINPDKRRSETKDGKSYQYNPGSENKKNTFVNRMKFLAGEQ
ncbi:MAG: hypothetical protein IPO83_02685 [Chitinophagaceae bacterium]|nr:hypothetical protein [Chitinophagaceae bacterium]